MKKLKFILPLLAFVMAIGLSFAFVGAENEDSYALKYIRVGSNWHPIDVTCGAGSAPCQVIFTEDDSETPYQAYNTQSLADPALGTADIKVIDGPVPSN